jgi:histidinol-phosphate aminotransferase
MLIEELVRENIRRLKPYSSARNEFSGEARVFLDANENSFGSPLPRAYNRYPDPLQTEIKRRAAAFFGAAPEEMFVGNGSDEAIDLLFRIFCEPRRHNAVVCPPTYGMYEVSAAINDVAIRRAPLTPDFELDPDAVARAADDGSRLLFICSPNNPTGNSFSRSTILGIVRGFRGIVVVDEAYADFSSVRSLVPEIRKMPNLVVLRTFSKAWGLAGLRVGMAFANPEITALFNSVKPPYNVSQIAQEAILQALDNRRMVKLMVESIVAERRVLEAQLARFPSVERVYPSDANFLLVRTTDAGAIYRFLAGEGIIVRDRSNVELCGNCLRITVGMPDQNAQLVEALGRYGS